jgi:hypothetical protein
VTALFRHPLIAFAVSLLALWLAAWLGARLRRGSAFKEDRRNDFGLILASTLTLLGLLIGFSFSMAAGRYDQRKNYEEAEANAIGTEYLRADLLPAADGAKVRGLLRKYLELRIRFYEASDDEVTQINQETARVQEALWSAVRTAAAADPNPVMAVVVSGMNDVINTQGYTQAAWLYRVPIAAGLLMGLIAFCANVLVGYGSASFAPRSPLLVVLPVVVSLAIALIVDIDTPRMGVINIVPQNLVILLNSIK